MTLTKEEALLWSKDKLRPRTMLIRNNKTGSIGPRFTIQVWVKEKRRYIDCCFGGGTTMWKIAVQRDNVLSRLKNPDHFEWPNGRFVQDTV